MHNLIRKIQTIRRRTTDLVKIQFRNKQRKPAFRFIQLQRARQNKKQLRNNRLANIHSAKEQPARNRANRKGSLSQNTPREHKQSRPEQRHLKAKRHFKQIQH